MLTREEEALKAKLLQELNELEEGARARQRAEAKTEKYSFKKIVDPENSSRIKKFQQIFGRYIPELISDEHATIHLHSRISGGLFLNPAETYSKASFEAEIKRFRRAIIALAESPIWGTGACIGIACNRSKFDGADDDIKHAAYEIYETLLQIGDLDKHYNTLPRVLDELEQWAREATIYLHDRRNINWRAVHAVDVLRRFWESWTESPAPRRALNPTSPFADYLRDGFDFFEIDGDPGAAFKRWVELEDKEPEKWK